MALYFETSDLIENVKAKIKDNSLIPANLMILLFDGI